MLCRSMRRFGLPVQVGSFVLRKAGRASKPVLLTVSEQTQWQLWASYASSFRKVMSDIRRIQEVLFLFQRVMFAASFCRKMEFVSREERAECAMFHQASSFEESSAGNDSPGRRDLGGHLACTFGCSRCAVREPKKQFGSV